VADATTMAQGLGRRRYRDGQRDAFVAERLAGAFDVGGDIIDRIAQRSARRRRLCQFESVPCESVSIRRTDVLPGSQRVRGDCQRRVLRATM